MSLGRVSRGQAVKSIFLSYSLAPQMRIRVRETRSLRACVHLRDPEFLEQERDALPRRPGQRHEIDCCAMARWTNFSINRSDVHHRCSLNKLFSVLSVLE